MEVNLYNRAQQTEPFLFGQKVPFVESFLLILHPSVAIPRYPSRLPLPVEEKVGDGLGARPSTFRASGSNKTPRCIDVWTVYLIP
jgi:hypothetical protein